MNAADPDGTTPLHWAVRADDLELATAARCRPVPTPGAANRYGVTPLSLAAVNGNAALVDAAAQRTAPTRASVVSRGQTVLMTAARTGNVDAVSALLDHGADRQRAGNAARRNGLDVGGVREPRRRA